MKREVDALYAAIEHGDPEHRAWLREALEAFYAGLPVPPARSQQTKSPYALLSAKAAQWDCNCAAMYEAGAGRWWCPKHEWRDADPAATEAIATVRRKLLAVTRN